MSDTDWRSYRCPVCGHADEVRIAEGESAQIACSHCEALLEVTLSRERAESVSVQLAKEREDLGGDHDDGE